MEDIQEQLADLRRRMARIDRKYAGVESPTPWSLPARAPRCAPAARVFIENLMSGEVVRTRAGEHFETTRLWERHRRHGSVDLSDLIELPGDLLEELSAGTAPHAPPERWAFLDTETTGLAGGTGTYAFLIG